MSNLIGQSISPQFVIVLPVDDHTKNSSLRMYVCMPIKLMLCYYCSEVISKHITQNAA